MVDVTAPAEGSPLATAAAPAPPPSLGDSLFPDGGAAVNKQPETDATTDTVEQPVGETTEEPKPEGEKPEAEAKPEAEEPKAETPKAADYKLDLPEGVQVDEANMGKFRETAEKLGLSQDAAQELVTLAADQAKTQAEAFAKSQSDAWAATIDSWKSSIEADKEIGGANAAKVQAQIGRALDEYGDAEVRTAFDLTGAGWNPAIIRFVSRMAAALGEGGPVLARGPAGSRPNTLGGTLYGATEDQT